MNEENHSPSLKTYWYDNSASSTEVLHALRRFRRSNQEMRRRMSGNMSMNVSDMQALQFVINAEAAGRLATPRDISRYLGISTASTTKLLDRLSDSGRLERHPHPTDRRALTLKATPEAHEQMHEHMSRMHNRMEEIVTAIPEESRSVVAEFLNSMATYLESEGSDPLD